MSTATKTKPASPLAPKAKPARGAKAKTSAKTLKFAKARKPIKIIGSVEGDALLKRYQVKAKALAKAQAEAKLVEDEVKALIAGHQYLVTDKGRKLFSWVFKMKSSFRAADFHKAHPALYNEFFSQTPDGTRAFSADGVKHVDVG